MTVTNKEAQATAVLFLAAGKSKAEAARQAGVDHHTVAAWLKKPAYAAEVERMRQVLAARPGRDELLAIVEDSRRRIIGPPAPPRPLRVHVPAGATRQELRESVVRAVVRRIASERMPDGGTVTVRAE